MGAYKEIQSTIEKEYKAKDAAYRERIAKWNSESSIIRVDKPFNIPRARSLGYKDIPGVIVARVKVKKGKRKRATPGGGRKPSKFGRYFSRSKSLQAIAEERAATRFSNCEVMNSYPVGSSGSFRFYEVILLERNNPSVLARPEYNAIVSSRGRAFRGVTHAGNSAKAKPSR